MDPWFPYTRRKTAPKLRLFCLPYAGGSASIFRTWADALPRTVELWPAQLPGREARIAEPALPQADALVEALARKMRPHLDLPYALFGHSMGGLLAFELARKLTHEGRAPPVHLFLSARQAPHLPFRARPVSGLNDAAFAEAIQDMAGTPAEVFKHPELVELLLPLLRADFAVCETYAHQPGPPLTCPVSVYGGLEDPYVRQEDLDAWRSYLLPAQAFAPRMFAGGHFFLQTARPQLLAAISEELGPYL